MFEQVEVNSKRWFDLNPLANEEFKDIPNYEKIYQISNYGRVKTLNRIYVRSNGKKQTYKEKIKKLCIDCYGYCYVGLSKNKSSKRIKTHLLVAKCFLPNKNNYTEINHKDGNKLNNCVSNLEFCTHSYNIQHAWDNDLISREKPSIRYGKNKSAKKIKIKSNGEIKEYDSIKRFIEKTNISYSTFYKKYNCGKNMTRL